VEDRRVVRKCQTPEGNPDESSQTLEVRANRPTVGVEWWEALPASHSSLSPKLSLIREAAWDRGACCNSSAAVSVSVPPTAPLPAATIQSCQLWWSADECSFNTVTRDAAIKSSFAALARAISYGTQYPRRILARGTPSAWLLAAIL
jgi:hypothetical protein